MMTTRARQTTVLFLLATLCFCGAAPRKSQPKAGAPGDWLPQVDPKLPNVLIIGDSISIGYYKDVRDLMKGKANVFRPCAADGSRADNCGDTGRGLENLDKWLGDRKWAVIHFNWGLHDLKYLNASNALDKAAGKQVRSAGDYAKNLDLLAGKLKATGARLIFATTTLVPEGEPGRAAGDDVKYNQVALEVVKKHGIKVNDLHALSASFAPAMFSKPGNVHYSAQGSKKLAEKVAASIAEELK